LGEDWKDEPERGRGEWSKGNLSNLIFPWPKDVDREKGVRSNSTSKKKDFSL